MDKDACVDCRRCEQVCDMGIPVARQGREHGRVSGLEDCMGCGRCVVSCPTDALEFRDVRNEFLPNLRMNGSYLLKRSGPPDIAPRIEPPKRPPQERCMDWHEDRAPLTLETAMEQARRCLDCGEPGCRSACPLHNRIPEWLEALGQGDVEGAAAICHTISNLPEICGTVCPAHRLCEGGCTLNAKGGPVIIGALERFINEEAFRRGWFPDRPDIRKNGKRVAVIGAGPAGLTCADELNKAGFDVTVFDKRNEIGGLLTYGVPAFKLDKSMIQRRRALLENAGVNFELGVNIDTNALRDLIDTNDALFLGTGAQQPRRIDIPGRDLDGVIDGLAYLDAVNSSLLTDDAAQLNLTEKRVVVLGGGDTAMDCARSAVRQGATSVTVAYRRGPEQMRASPKEITAAREEGVEFLYYRMPATLTGTGRLQGVRFAGENEQGNEEFRCDIVIVAFGQEAGRGDWLMKLGIETDAHGFVVVDENGQTSHPKIFSGGDSTHGPDLVVSAVAAGRCASRGIRDATA